MRQHGMVIYMNIMTIDDIFKYLNEASPAKITLLSVVIVFMLGVLDHIIGPELASSIFYVIPISMAAWYGTRQMGFAMCLLSALVWLLTDITAGKELSSNWVFVWNMLVRLGLFVIISELICEFRKQYDYKANAANTDQLTGILNYGGFFYRAHSELQRCKRYHHPVSVVFFDLDNFKWVNDHLGHAEGDGLLKYVCQLVIGNTRQTDIFGRLGGDEFAVLLTETKAEDAAVITEKIRQLLADEMKQREWPVSFSMGLITFDDCPDDMKHVISLADELMYTAKRGGKNNIVKLHYSPEQRR